MDFEARIAAIPYTAAVPLPLLRKRKQDDEEGSTTRSEAASAISGWLKGVAASSGDPHSVHEDEADDPEESGKATNAQGVIRDRSKSANSMKGKEAHEPVKGGSAGSASPGKVEEMSQ